MLLAFLFDSAGFGEWFVLLAVVLVAVGPKNLPSAARKLGQWYARFRRHAEGFKRQLMEMDTEFERAVDSAAREAEEAAKIPDFEEPVPEPPEEPASKPAEEPEPEPVEEPAPEPAEMPTEATDGDQPAEEP